MLKFRYLLILAILLLSGCAKIPLPKDTLFFAIRSDPPTLNPITSSDNSSHLIISTIFNSLVKYDACDNIVGDLAENWELSEDGKSYTFKLKKGIKWHDGAPFTAEDVKFTFQKLFEPETNTYNRALYQVNGKNPKIEVLSGDRIRFTLPEPFAPFLSNLTQLGIIPKHLLEGKDINRDSFNWNPIGTGPFKLKEWRSSERILLQANLDYFEGAPKLKRIAFIIIPSAESKRIALLTGSVDMGEITPEDLRALSGSKELKIYDREQYVYYFMGYDLSNKLFDHNLRAAINYATDKQSIINAIFQKNAEPAYGPIPTGSKYYSDSCKKYQRDLKKAKLLLHRSGWREKKGKKFLYRDGESLQFEVCYPSSSTPCEKAAVFLQAQLAEVGIDMHLKGMEFSALLSRCNPKEFQAVILNWAENCDPDCYTEWHSSQIGENGMNFVSYSNPKVDRLLEAGRATTDPTKRKEIYAQFQKVVTEDAPYLFLWSPRGLVAVNKRVENITPPSASGGILINAQKIYIK